MGFDFYGYDMNMAILTPEGTGIIGIQPPETLVELGQQGNLAATRSRFDPEMLLLRECMESMSVTVLTNGTPVVEVALTPPMEVSMRILNSTLFNVGNLIAVKFGYPDQPAQVTDWLACFLLAPQVKFGVPIRFTLRAQGLGMGLPRTTPSYRWEDGTRLSYLRAVLQPYGLVVELEGNLKTGVERAAASISQAADSNTTLRVPTAGINLFSGPQVNEQVIDRLAGAQATNLALVKHEVPEAYQLVEPHNCDQNEDDFAFINRLMSESNVISRWENEKLILALLSEKLAQPPVVGFRWYGAALTRQDPTGAIHPDERLPIIEFDADVTVGFTGPSAVAMRMEGLNPFTYKVKDPTVQHVDRPGQGSQSNSGDDPKTPKLTQFVVNRESYRGEVQPIKLGILGSATQVAVQPLRELNADKQECPMRVQLPRGGGVGANNKEGYSTHHSQVLNSMYSNFTASLLTIGVPTLKPMSIVHVEGIGRYSGNYYVLKIEHTIDNSGFKSRLHLVRTGTDQPASSGSQSLRGTQTQNVNRQAPVAPLGGRTITPKFGDHVMPSEPLS